MVVADCGCGGVWSFVDVPVVTEAAAAAAAAAFSLRECQTAWLESDERHLNFFLQLGRSQTNGSSPVCKRRCALRLYFFEKDLRQFT